MNDRHSPTDRAASKSRELSVVQKPSVRTRTLLRASIVVVCGPNILNNRERSSRLKAVSPPRVSVAMAWRYLGPI